jgi:hypothetical protein
MSVPRSPRSLAMGARVRRSRRAQAHEPERFRGAGGLGWRRLRPGRFSWELLGVLPFLLFATLFLILPTSFLIVGALQDSDGR